MANIFKPKRSSTASAVPTTNNLADGELAVNSADQKIYLRDGNSVVEVANASSGSGGISSVSEDTTPQLGGDLQTNGNDILFADNDQLRFGSATGGDFNIVHGTAGQLSYNQINILNGNLAISDSSSNERLKLTNNGNWEIKDNAGTSRVTVTTSGATVTGALAAGGLTYPSSDGTNGQVLTTNGQGTLSFTTVSGGGGISDVVEDTTPQLGGDLDLNSNDITGTGNFNVTGVITATSFVKSGGTSSQFLKADGSVDTSTYITSADGGNAATLDSIDSTSFLRSDQLDNVTSGGIIFNDNIRLNLGTGQNNDSFLFYDGTNANFHVASGDLIIATKGGEWSGDDIIIESADDFEVRLNAGTNIGSGTTAIYATGGGSVKLNHNGSTKFETISTGAYVSGNLGIGTNNPSTKLDVDGNVDISGTIDSVGSIFSSGTLYLNDSAGNFAPYSIGPGGGLLIQASNANNNDILLRGISGNIKIGTGVTVNDASGDTYFHGAISVGNTTGTSGQVLKSTGTGLEWGSASGGISNVVEDTTPQLGGDLQTNGNDILFADNDQLRFGSATGGDFNIVHGTAGQVSYNQINVLNGNLAISDSSSNERVRLTNNGNWEIKDNAGTSRVTVGAGVTVTGDLLVSNNARISGILTVGSSSITLNGSDNSIHGFDTLIAPPKRDDTVDISVTVGSKTTANRYYDQGSSSCYFLNGIESPFLTLTPGRTYRFTLSSSDMTNHPFRLYLEADKTTAYTTNVTSASTYTEIVVTDTTPTVLHYQCSAHSLMGNAVQVNSNKVDTPYQIDGLNGANITGVTTSTSFVKSSNSGGFLKADGTEDTNTYLTSLGTAIVDGDFTSNGFMKRTGAGTYAVDSNTYLTSYTETDPVVAAINGIVKSDGSTISAATAGTDYLTPSGDGSSLTGLTGANNGTYGSATATPVIVVDTDGRITGISTVAISGGGGGGSVSETFKTIAVSGQSDVVADSATDTLTLVAGSNMTITTNANGDSITFASSGGGGSSSSTVRSVNRYVATNNQTLFPSSGTVSYSVGYIDVYLNGSKLDSTEFTASNGTTVTLTTGASTNDIVELIAYTNVSLTNVTVVNDTTPQLGGDLDLNGNDITGTGNINVTGTATVTGGQVATQNDAIAFAIALG